jgi:glutamyl-tRNA reductase
VSKFAIRMNLKSIEKLHVLAFTHRNIPVGEIGDLHIETDHQKERLQVFKEQLALEELLFLSTCNRVEFMFTTSEKVDHLFLERFFKSLYSGFEDEKRNRFVANVDVFQGISAVEHLLSVASSVDSMVVGEREIITQVRNAFELSKQNELTGDLIRIVIRHTIETAKRVYTETNIARKPVSVVSLAYHRLRDLNVPLDSRILIVGAGMTNTNMGRFLKKHGFKTFHVFNRTFEKAEKLAKDLGGVAHPLSDLSSYSGGFDVIITCTGADHHVLTPEIYTQLLQNEEGRKTVIDLAIPQDLSPEIVNHNKVTHISIELLQQISNENLKERSKEIQHVEEIITEALYEFQQIYKMREIELAMRSVPLKVKEIKSAALNEVFKAELDSLDPESRDVLDKVLAYMEKKYMSMPMIMAKEILLNNPTQ